MHQTLQETDYFYIAIIQVELKFQQSKYIKVEGKENKIIIPWKTDNHELADFKGKTILAILGVDKSLFTYTNNLEESGSLTWKLGKSSFQDFLDAASLVLEIKKITCTLNKENSKVAIQTQMAFKKLKTNLLAEPSVQATTPQEPPPTAGAPSGAILHENIGKIFENHDACEQFPEEYFVITMIKADEWAREMVSKPIKKRLLQLLQNHSNNALAQLEGIKEMMTIIQNRSCQICHQHPQIMEPPSMIFSSFLGSIQPPAMSCLTELVVTHWSLLQHVTVEELISVNIPVAQSQALMLAFLEKQAKKKKF
ncbi:hypothetical protein VP01_1074g4 [Puccinia sorghi]|uniref:Uncharacterized protein n=1 Tax=Puccinia sorghi TaxID=27349 RepID=A0A0L6VUZ9_9BASI|nr:hypothetical protein VP01_1074g4 [Puccinia sorghi]